MKWNVIKLNLNVNYDVERNKEPFTKNNQNELFVIAGHNKFDVMSENKNRGSNFPQKQIL